MQFANQVALITGGAGGIGGGTAEALLRAGARVAVVDVSEAALAIRREQWQGPAAEGRVLFVAGDVTSRAGVQAVVDQVQGAWGRIDVLVNCAGGSYDTPVVLAEVNEEHFAKVLDGNLKSAFFMCQACAPVMKAQNYGRIVNIASIAGRAGGVVTGGHYAAAKGGIIALTKHLAQELGSFGVTTNATAPGLVLSGPRMKALWERMPPERKARALDPVPVGRPSAVEEQVAAIVFLASPGASFVNGAIVDVNGGRYSA